MDDQSSIKKQPKLDDLLSGLRQPKKRLPSKYFYDERGSRLFEQITKLDEYYLTRTEIDILETNVGEIIDCVGSHTVLVELGSGSSKKTRLLLDSLPDLQAYIPVDISEKFLLNVVSRLREDYPHISIIPVFADYTSRFDLPELGKDYNKQVVFFPGSTIGNFKPEQASDFLSTIASLTDDNSGMLIGVDLKKEKAVLETAYNDEEGITAKFNKNMLLRLNREFGAEFDPTSFAHRAFYNEEEGRIEMHLVSRETQSVEIAGETFRFEQGESIHTENSYKYSLDEFKDMVSEWYAVDKVWTDDNNYFSIQFLVKK